MATAENWFNFKGEGAWSKLRSPYDGI